MAPTIGHAAFHIKNIPHGAHGNRNDRRNLLKESMRHLDPRDLKRHAAKNLSIVASETHLNTAFVNDDCGGFAVTSNISEVLEYGDKRQKLVLRKISAGHTSLNTFVVHLPKSLCTEILDYYPRRSKDGSLRIDPETGAPMSRSRWVPNDRDQAMRYFEHAVKVLSLHVVPGGHESIHGWATNFDETTPHIQIMADPFAPDPDATKGNGEALRTEQSRAYGMHRGVVDDHGKQINGRQKLQNYQHMFRYVLADWGWPVDYAVSARHGRELSKTDYEELHDAEADVVAVREAMAAKASTQEALKDYLEDREATITASYELDVENLIASQAELDLERASFDGQRAQLDLDLPRLRAKAEDDGRARGLASADAVIERRVAAALVTVRQGVETERDALEAERLRLRKLADVVEADLAKRGPMPEAPTYEEIERVLTDKQSDIAIKFIRTLQAKDGSTPLVARFEQFTRREYARAVSDMKVASLNFREWQDQTHEVGAKIRESDRTRLVHAHPRPDVAHEAERQM